MKKVFLSFLLLFGFTVLLADVKLPKLFSDNMVLQRSHEIKIWGWASAKEKITITLHNQSKSAKADNNGKWMVSLASEEAGGPYILTVKGKNTIILNNVLIGDVWICSGQSNMEWPLSSANDAKNEIKDADFPEIRQFLVTKSVALEPQADVKGGDWKVCNPETAGNFTAVGYFFARELQRELHVPIGLINTSWGGTHSETWTSKGAFEGSDEFKSMIADLPSINLDELAKVRGEEVKKKIMALQGNNVNTASAEILSAVNTDDSQWPKMLLPGLWEQKQLPDFDGTIWFRKSITLTAEEAASSATLELGMIDDNDITYVNGVEIGKTNSYNTPRKYVIPPHVLKEGKNVIAVEVVDTGGGGGIYGESDAVALSFSKNHISLAGEWLFQVTSIAEGTSSVGPNTYPTLLYNAMISPLIPYTIKGAIWYQGEANADRAYQYRKAFPLMITDWRKHWNLGDFPFYFVQLATFNAANGTSKTGSTWAELREAQTMTLSLPNTGMAITTDIGNPTDIHPRNKQDVGKRLAAVALHHTYSKNIAFSGPTFQSMKADGDKLIVTFNTMGTGLMTTDKYGYIKGFEIAGEDKVFHYAKAFIENDHVVVYQNDVRIPATLRYGWADNDEDNNLFNKEGFPAIPFRTDQWKGITESNKFTISH